MHRIDGVGATSDNKFTEGNPTSGTPATEVTADFMNAVQEEIARVILTAGIALNKANNGQLLEAIQSLIAGGGSSVTATGVSIVDAGDFFTGGNVEVALQQLAGKVYAGTLDASQVRRLIITLAGASHQSETAHLENFVEVSNAAAAEYVLRSDADMPAPLGSAIQLCQAGAGKLTITASSGVTILRPAAFKMAALQQHAILVLVKRAANTWRLGGALEAV